MKNALRGVAFFLATLAVGEVVRRLLMSRIGEVATDRLGRPELATYEGASGAGREVRKAVGFVRTIATGRQAPDRKKTAPVAPAGWVGAARDASEMLLAVGAVLKTVSDFAREDTKLRRRVSKSATYS